MSGYEGFCHCEQMQILGEKINESMNEWRGETSSPADSYIEWRFEYKCKQLSGGFDIITEWRIHKQEYIGRSNTTIFDFQHYSRHDVTHSISILESIELLLGRNRIDLLSAGDLWLLLEVAYGHDLGMTTEYDELARLWKEDEKFQQFIYDCLANDLGELSEAALFYKEADNLLRNKDKMASLLEKEEVEYQGDWPVLMQKYIMLLAAEYIRKRHADRAHGLLAEPKEKEAVIPSRLYLIAGIAAQMHGRDFCNIFEELEYRVKGFGVGKIHPQFAAAMLRIGDLLDIDNNRFNPYAVAHFGRLPMASLLHFKKHKCITHIDISECEIAAKAHTDEYEVAVLTNDWFQSINDEVKNLICHWNEIVPEALTGCTLKPGRCEIFLKNSKNGRYHRFDNQMDKMFTVNKKKLINLLIGTSIYDSEKDFLREYLQNALDASKMQMWIDLKDGKYEHLKNPKVTEWKNLTPFDLEKTVYDNYKIEIKVGWNAAKDKIQLKIQDRGIGIEGNYLKLLTNIGTGWQGRNYYEKELKEMVRWLFPTGGFGIGIQSAFMVTDTVEILTKSEKDNHAYRIILRNPGKEGYVSAEEVHDYYTRGTIVTLELKAGNFQKWMRDIGEGEANLRKCMKYKRDFRPEKWDEFDPEANLLYICDFLYQYIQNTLSTSIFPIEVISGIKKGRIYRSLFWPNGKYWEDTSENVYSYFIQKEKRYLCIYSQKGQTNNVDGSVLVWDMNDCVLLNIHPEVSLRNGARAYFKNVVVEHVDDTQFGMFGNYELYIDFMGLSAEECLKVHRNAFNENFNLEQYCYDGTRAYMKFVWEKYNECEIRNPSDQELAGKEYLKKAWTSFELQMLRLLCFNDIGKCADISSDRQMRVMKGEIILSPDDKVVIAENEKIISASEIMVFLNAFYNQLYGKTGDGLTSDGILLAIKEEDLVKLEKDKVPRGESEIHPNLIKRWHEDNRNDADERENNVLDLLIKGIGGIKESFVAQMLICDTRLYRTVIKMNQGLNYLFLSFPKEKKMFGKEFIFKEFWSSMATRVSESRKYVTTDQIEDYAELWVKELPFAKKYVRRYEGYLISPISASSYLTVMQYIGLGRYMDYNIFRELIWGGKGHETQEYHMLIDWVLEHQCITSFYRRSEIVEIYEKLLHDIYKAEIEV